MNVLITGGTGFIGRNLCRRLVAQGDSVTVLTRSSEAASRTLGGAVQTVERWDEIRLPIDAVVNLAGANLASRRWTSARKKELVESRVHTTQALVKWIERTSPRPRVLISGSAIGWYGSDRADELLTEDGAKGDDFPAQLCQAWEAAARSAERLGVRVCVVRTGVVIGRGGGALSRMLPAFRVGLGGPIGSGQQWMSWIAMTDWLAMACWMITHTTASGVYNATAPQPVRNEEFARTLAACLGRPCLVRAPASVLRAVLGEMAELVTCGQRVIPQRVLDEGFIFSLPSLHAAMTQDVL